MQNSLGLISLFPMGTRFHYATIWEDNTPVNYSDQGTPLVLGLRLKFTESGRIVGWRFHVKDNDPAEHFGMILREFHPGIPLRGSRMKLQPGSGSDSSGHWVNCYFSNYLDVAVDEELTIAAWTQFGKFASTENGLQTSEFVNGPITVLQDGDGGPNGVFTFGDGWNLGNDYNGNFYAIDVLYLTDSEAGR